MDASIPDASVRRLSAYLRQLEHLAEAGVEQVSSRQLAEHIKAGAAQVRRDLALFGQFGQPGRGYRVGDLIGNLRRILGTQQPWKVIVVGTGLLGLALLRYPSFAGRGFELVGALDSDNRKVGKKVGDVAIRHTDDMESVVKETGARLAVLSVPPGAAQDMTRRLAEAGIEGILNFSTPVLESPNGVHITHVDITAHLEQLSFQLTSSQGT